MVGAHAVSTSNLADSQKMLAIYPEVPVVSFVGARS